MDRFFNVLIILLGFSLVYCSFRCCSTTTKYLKFNRPPSTETFWQEGFVIWPRLPVRISVAPGPLHDELWHDAVNAVHMWNTAIGCKVLEMSEDVTSEVVVSIKPHPVNTNWIGSSTFVHRRYPPKLFWGSDIDIYEVRIKDTLLRANVMGHEIGHTLGLDDLRGAPANIMNHTCESGTDIDKSALEALHKIYCAE